MKTLVVMIIILWTGLAQAFTCQTDCDEAAKIKKFCGVKWRGLRSTAKFCTKTDWTTKQACKAFHNTHCLLQRTGRNLARSGSAGPQLVFRTAKMDNHDSILPEFHGEPSFCSAGSSSHDPEGDSVSICVDPNSAKYAIEDAETQGGMICDNALFNEIRKKTPGVYWEKVSVSRFCKGRWQHLPNGFRHLYKREFFTDRCIATWSFQTVLRHVSKGDSALTFKCTDLRDEIAARKEQLKVEANKQHGEYTEKVKQGLENLLTIVDVSKDPSVQEAGAELKAAVDEHAAALVELSETETKLIEAKAAHEAIQVQAEAIEADLTAFQVEYDQILVLLKQTFEEARSRLHTIDQRLTTLKRHLSRNAKIAGMLQEWMQTYFQQLTTTRLSIEQAIRLDNEFQGLLENEYETLCVGTDIQDLIEASRADLNLIVGMQGRLQELLEKVPTPPRFLDLKSNIQQAIDTLDSQITPRHRLLYAQELYGLPQPEPCTSFPKLGAAIARHKTLARSSEYNADFRDDIWRRMASFEIKQQRFYGLSDMKRSLRIHNEAIDELMQQGKIIDAMEAHQDFIAHLGALPTTPDFQSLDSSEKRDAEATIATYRQRAEKRREEDFSFGGIKHAVHIRLEIMVRGVLDMDLKFEGSSDGEAALWWTTVRPRILETVVFDRSGKPTLPEFSNITQLLEFAHELKDIEDLLLKMGAKL